MNRGGLPGRVFLLALRALPKSTLSRAVGRLTRARPPRPLLQAAMRAFAARYALDLEECGGLAAYRSFGDFFARPLLPGRRPIAPGDEVIVSPVDAVVSQRGVAEEGRLLQTKGLAYDLANLFADAALAARFRGGAYATLYLAPRDYHRIHAPLAGRITGWRYVPGKLWPVNPVSVRGVPGLFTVNERLVTLLETPLGGCALVAVGATIVGRIRAFYDPDVPLSNLRGARPRARDYAQPIPVEKGAELATFEMGSTVVLLLEPGRADFDAALVPGARVRVGEAIGRGAGPRTACQL